MNPVYFKMPLPTLPYEIRACIFFFLDDWILAELIPEVFWAIAPHRFKSLRLGGNRMEPFPQMPLVNLYPNCGHFVHKLSVSSDPDSTPVIIRFLEQLPPNNNLNHLALVLSTNNGSSYISADIPYIDLIQNVVELSNSLTRLSFIDIIPCANLINVLLND